MNNINANNNGIIYYNRGNSCVARLIVSLDSLRKHYTGNVCVFMEGENLEKLSDDLKTQFNVDVIYDSNSQTTTYVRAVEICMKSPYQNSIWMDSDTIILNNIDDMFEHIPDNDLVIANFAGWSSSGSKIKKRIHSFNNMVDQDTISKAINYGPAINCGVYGFNKNSTIFPEWLELSKKGEEARVFIPDEVACQILLPKYKVHILEPKYNVSVRYGEKIEDKKIIHFHGRKHCRACSLAKVWLKEFIGVLEKDTCSISKYIYADRQLRKFMVGKHGMSEYVDQAQKTLRFLSDNNPSVSSIINQNIDENINQDKKQKQEAEKKNIEEINDNSISRNNTTIVTAIDTKYIDYLKIVLPNWIKYKSVDKFPMIVYINGFNKKTYQELNFLTRYSNIEIIEWDMKNAESQREKMLSSFVLGAARDVKTKYWLKLDVDLFMNNYSNLVENWMYDYCLVGHKWGYTKPAEWVKKLDEWSEANNYFDTTNHMFEEKNVNKNKYWHKRLQSIVQLHRSDFVRYAANLADERLPVPSHDTYLWYVAVRSGLPVKRHNFKKHSGVCHQKDLNSIFHNVTQLDVAPPQEAVVL
jgi:hypothetical protein